MENLSSRWPCLSNCLPLVVSGFLFFVHLIPVTGFAEISPPITPVPDEDGVQRITIVMESYSFSPNDIIIQADKPVSIRLENHSFLIPHNFVIDNPTMGLHHEIDISAGDSVNLQLFLTTPAPIHFIATDSSSSFPVIVKKAWKAILKSGRSLP